MKTVVETNPDGESWVRSEIDNAAREATALLVPSLPGAEAARLALERYMMSARELVAVEAAKTIRLYHQRRPHPAWVMRVTLTFGPYTCVARTWFHDHPEKRKPPRPPETAPLAHILVRMARTAMEITP